ncbi:MAG: Glu/Leu/Phe/Val dehydrogenase [Planctomycetes bacterium]|nr:Glu/Leu/Phe/Val dehydrogenase [Planctomycetota bacterium]
MDTNIRAKTQGILETAVWNIEQAAKRLDLDSEVLAMIAEPKEVIEIWLDPRLPDGKRAHIKAFISRHNDTLGPAKGGIRMTDSVSRDEIVGLSMEMTWKSALVGVPFGGGKAGIRCDPASLAPVAKEAVIRSFTNGVRRHIGPEVYVPAPDMGTNEQDMGHVRDCVSYATGTAITRGCFVTGKPVILGGIVGRREATGKGVVYAIEAACERLGMNFSHQRVAIQGFGNVGGVAAVELARRHAKIVAVADITGGTCNPDGLDIPTLANHVRTADGVRGFPGGKAISNEQLLQTDCDILIPAATGSVITGENAGKIQAKLIAEGANAPTTPKADEILNSRGIFVIPDILCNAGGVFVSYLEYTQETQREQTPIEEVERRLAGRLKETFSRVHHLASAKNEPMRHAAMDIAVARVVEGIIARGTLP